ncbi:uncharacterized protein LOC118485007 [Helianthus annuus]|uniref:uncharacterized protein LOC118485007 n=1 Tax=Helianthus annuus TaxID=4232 RepID=UPI000B8F7DF4|nr:uncharacterized protein LOC118485007 [Helianthus annuus]
MEMSTDEFIINTPLRNIYDLWQIMKPQSVIILGTITGIDKHFGWHYMECPKCLIEAGTDFIDSPSMEEQFFYVCKNPNCDESVIYPVPRFKIKVQVEDNSDDVPLILFHPLVDEIIEKVVLKSAEQLFQENITPVVEKVIFPVDLDNLIGKKFAFKIEITKYNLTNFDEMYFVTNLTDDESIINELKEKMKITEVNDKEFIKKKSHIPSVKDDDVNTSCETNKNKKRTLDDVYVSSTSSTFNTLEKVSKKLN